MISDCKKNIIKHISGVSSCGSLESSDVLVTIEPNVEHKINISIKSPFIKQFGQRMKEIIQEILNQFNIISGNIIIQDQGAIDMVLIARLTTALKRQRK